MRAVSLLIVLVVLTLLGGCGDDDDATSSVAMPSTVPAKVAETPNGKGTAAPTDGFKSPGRRAVLLDKVGDARPPWDITKVIIQARPQTLEVELHYRVGLRPRASGQGFLVGVEIDAPPASDPLDVADYEVDSLRGSRYYPDRLALAKGPDLRKAPCEGLRFTPFYQERRVSFGVPRSCLRNGGDALRVKGFSYLPRGPSGQADYVDRWSQPVTFD